MAAAIITDTVAATTIGLVAVAVASALRPIVTTPLIVTVFAAAVTSALTLRPTRETAIAAFEATLTITRVLSAVATPILPRLPATRTATVFTSIETTAALVIAGTTVIEATVAPTIAISAAAVVASGGTTGRLTVAVPSWLTFTTRFVAAIPTVGVVTPTLITRTVAPRSVTTIRTSAGPTLASLALGAL
ncbi:hypothetical protein [Dermacoccus abyssi]|uniref:hypothetical protein n=1 Tax=Dermacoccus abyssi TaxID=322596 RepID=UPI002AD51641|nr:hypothetical protein [Dermacoccus abyssi]